jgi:two-component system response regulator YesN
MECFQLRAAEALQGTTEADTVADLLVEGAPRLARAVAESRNSRNLTLVRKALAYMEREYARDISLDEIAAVVHLSPYYFSHVFKEETGVTFVERLTSIRMLHARRLLTTTDWPVTAVAKATGYRDLNYFCRVFKRYVGQTPRRYRQQHQI